MLAKATSKADLVFLYLCVEIKGERNEMCWKSVRLIQWLEEVFILLELEPTINLLHLDKEQHHCIFIHILVIQQFKNGA